MGKARIDEHRSALDGIRTVEALIEILQRDGGLHGIAVRLAGLR